MVKGKFFGVFGFIELNYGSDLGFMEMIVCEYLIKKGCYLFKGFKIWIINLFIVDVFFVWVKFQEIGKICGFFVDRKDCFVGIFEIFKISNKIGFCVFIIGMIYFEDCFVFKENMFFGVEGLKGLFVCLNSV